MYWFVNHGGKGIYTTSHTTTLPLGGTKLTLLASSLAYSVIDIIIIMRRIYDVSLAIIGLQAIEQRSILGAIQSFTLVLTRWHNVAR